MLDAAEHAILESLDVAVWRALRLGKLDAAIGRVRAELAREASLKLAWETVPLDAFDAVPAPVQSAWIFVLRKGSSSGAERHPNSVQRVMSYRGTGDLQLWNGTQWVSQPLTSGDAALERRWLAIPENVWHRPVIPAGADWVVVSFHTATGRELIEERPQDDESPDEGRTERAVYEGRRGR
ncbi:MAG: cupin domain-containing protein [Acidobacteria bacterium]|nr:cupin domain-containing protein [Acidobacteriota bacterium]MCA1651127.1 cupin domain-containing protein [Acidobacteriota bacterium]